LSFLNQLKSQANALQSREGQQRADLEQNTAQTEQACRAVLHYLQDLARQLNVIAPAAPRLTLDGKTPWPAMKLVAFRVDARKKMLRDKEVFDYIAIGWQIVPQVGQPVGGSVSVNFPPDLERVESRLALGSVKHERKEQRHPEKNTLQALRFDYLTESRGNVTVKPDHDEGTLAFRLVNLDGFGVVNTSWPASRVHNDTLDELAKLVVSQPSRFV
jgi:hypothetical protein